jgi:hypothetical protein
LSWSMHIGGGPSNFWRLGLEPSAAGQSVDTLGSSISSRR